MGSALINLAAVIDTFGGTQAAPLQFTAQVMRGGSPALRVAAAQATLPAPLAAYWTGSSWSPTAPALVDVDLDCYWQVELSSVDRSVRLVRTVILPAGHGPNVDFGALVNVDPATLAPTPSAVAGWAATAALAQQVKASFDALVAGAPTALDTFLEVSQQLAADESGAAALATLVATKQNATQVAAAIAAQATQDSATYATLAQLAANPDQLAVGTITRDSNGAATSFSVVWPDGSTGTFTGTASTTVPGAVDSYTVTKVKSGTTVTFTQPALTRNSTGAVTNRPAMTVS